MSVMIEQIRFQNYRQYQSGVLHFDTASEHKLTAFVAQNGTGKTTILNAMTWCLYGKEYQISDASKALPIVNTKVLNTSEELVDVKVTICVRDEHRSMEFIRTHTFNKRNPKIAFEKNFSAVETPYGAGNSQSYEGEAAEAMVKQFFDEAIYNFYFFDGEKLQDFFNTKLKQPIYNLSQITLLDNAIDHTKKYQKKLTGILRKDIPNIQKLQEQKEALESQITNARMLADTARKDKAEANRNVGDLDSRLRGYHPVKNLQEHREEMEKEFEQIEEKQKEMTKRQSAFIREYIVLLNLYPRIMKAYHYIDEKMKHGDLPPTIDKAKVQHMLDHTEEPCPLCHASLTEDGIVYLRGLLERIAVSSRTSNFLSEMKAPLEIAIEEARRYKEKRDRLRNESEELENQRRKIENEISNISTQLSGFVSNDGSLNVRELEDERERQRKTISDCERQILIQENLIKEEESKVKELTEKISDAIQKGKITAEAKREADISVKLQKDFEAVKDKIVGRMKEEVAASTWKYFKDMIWKKNTFGKIDIDDEYAVSVYNGRGEVMTESLSATEKMALAYAFTLAVHEASGKNCPLLIDSPLGRVSDKNRERMAESLLEVSREKQIIMLFTPDEYSAEVAEVYTGKVNQRQLRLSDDETHVEGLGEL